MGVIQDSIFTIYKKALEEGNMLQAEKAVEIMGFLKKKVDIDGFQDHSLEPVAVPNGTFFQPFQYRYYMEERMVVIEKSAILLTESENKLFYLFTNYETEGVNIKVVTHHMIKKHMWENMDITNNALRIAINRLRIKVEQNPRSPQILISFHKRGYLFLGKQIYS